MAVEADLDEASEKASNTRKAQQARQRVLDKWLGLEAKFRDPVAASTNSTNSAQDVSKTGVVTSEKSGEVVL